jgi:hypothetical protein
LDEIPEISGVSWNPEIAFAMQSQAIVTQNSVSTTTQTNLTRNEDGSYSRTFTRSVSGSPTFTQTDTQNTNGSGEDQNNGTGPTGGTTMFSAPAMKGGKYAITVVYTPPSGSPTTTIVPDWFPGNGRVVQLVTDERKDNGTVLVPTQCTASAGQKAVAIRDIFSALDVVKGTYDKQSVDSYIIAGEGRVCEITTRVLTYYDNLVTGQVLYSENFNGVDSLTTESLQQLRAHHMVVGF